MAWTAVHYALDLGVGPPPTTRYIYSYLDWTYPGKVPPGRESLFLRSQRPHRNTASLTAPPQDLPAPQPSHPRRRHTCA